MGLQRVIGNKATNQWLKIGGVQTKNFLHAHNTSSRTMGKYIFAKRNGSIIQRLTVRHPHSHTRDRQSSPKRIENSNDGLLKNISPPNIADNKSIIQRLTINRPNGPSGSRQSGPTRINNTYSVRWTAFIRDDTLCFEFEKTAMDAATIRVNLYDDQMNGWIGSGAVAWATNETGYKYIEFSDFPSRPLGDVMDSCEFETILTNDDHPRRGISAWRSVY